MAFQTYLIESITAALRWLNDWPVGLKLNTPLSQFFSTSLSLVVERWSSQPAIVIGVELIVNPVRPAQSLNRILHPLLYRPSRLVQPCRVHSTPCRCQRPFQTPRFTPHHLFLHHQPHVPMAAGFLRLAVQPLPRYLVPPTFHQDMLNEHRRQEMECPAGANGYIRIRCRSAVSRYSLIHGFRLPLSDSAHVCDAVYIRTISMFSMRDE